jgi:CRISPR-associated endonuclease/helicase Cas3
VNRRTVVDQSSAEVYRLKARLLEGKEENDPILSEMYDLLQSICTIPDVTPLGISTLRGEMADNLDWSRDPARPAVIIGTVDMIGSRLLFRGYGDGRWKRSFHAGLLGQDALFVHDEAHLTPAFGKLLRAVRGHQKPSGKPFQVIELSATPLGSHIDDSFSARSFRWNDQDLIHPVTSSRFCSYKKLLIHAIASAKECIETVTSLALSMDGNKKRVLVYVNSPDDALKVANGLIAQVGEDAVRLLTGTMRGHERDLLAEQDQVFKGFLVSSGPLPAEAKTTYLVSTSAGEVGIDLNADAAIMDMADLGRFIQRLGRVNRTGDRPATIFLVHPQQLDDETLQATIDLLHELPALEDGRSVSPQDLSGLITHPGYAKALGNEPRYRELEPYHLDTWAMTSLRTDDALPVAPWLHGLTEKGEEPDTWFVWRDDIPRENPTRTHAWLSVFPILPHERARLPKGRAIDFFKGVFKDNPGEILMLNNEGILEVASSEDLINQPRHLAYATIIFDGSDGGLGSHGVPDHKSKDSVRDVSTLIGGREKWKVSSHGKGWVARPSAEGEDAIALAIEVEDPFDAICHLESTRGLRCAFSDIPEISDDDEAPSSFNVWMIASGRIPPDDLDLSSVTVTKTMGLEDHLQRASVVAKSLAQKAQMPDSIVNLLSIAASMHDLGKNRPWWQAAIGNLDKDHPLAKSGRRTFNQTLCRGYRHELGSLFDTADPLAHLDEEGRDLVLHLVATHHGYGRPHFEDRAYDLKNPLESNRREALDALRRFPALQREFGWWGLAYLEALLKTADVMASE